MVGFNLQEVLDECKKSARAGHEIAANQYKLLRKTIVDAEDKIEEALSDFNTSTCYLSDATSSLSQQLVDTQSALDSLSFAFRDDLQTLRDNLGKFSITLFGRTMAGKSTLMEILTHGDGSSIGHGSQRTTQDVRSYHCDDFGDDLTITDVPGISAVEGEEDESIAFNAAKQADLILFLVTDDGPQASEADCLEHILRMGKPVICIMNVKVSINKEKSTKLALRDIEKKFDYNRLNTIRDQFCSYASKAGQSWRNIPFVFVHLQSAFLAQQTTDAIISDNFHKASRIDSLKDMIIWHVRTKGQFYRVKTFIDVVTNPMINSLESLLEQSLINSAQGRTILAKKRKLEQWRLNFKNIAWAQISSCVAHIKSELNAEIAPFAEEHFTDPQAEKAWHALLQERRIQEKCQDLLKSFEEQCNVEIREISREITSELNYTTSMIDKRSLHIGHIIDGKRIWNWTATIAGGGLTIGSIITGLTGAAIAGPLAWAALAIGVVGMIGSLLFTSRDQQEHEARTRMEESLKKSVLSLCDSCKRQMEKNLALLLQARITNMIQELTRIDSVLFRLSDTQRELAWYIDNNLLDLNIQFLKQALHLINSDGLEYHIQAIARIPGSVMTMILKDNVVFPEDQCKQLTSLTGEDINFTYYSPNKRILISRIIGKKVNRSKITIEGKIGVAHVPADSKDPYVKERIRMAQQLSQIAITK